MELSYKQYLIANQTLETKGMVEIPLGEGLRLYVGKDLRVRQGLTGRGIPYILIGEAYCTDSFPREVIEDLDLATVNDAFAISQYWTGRWALIFGQELVIDACGLMSAFYHQDDNGWVVSSSIALISNQLGLDNDKKVSANGLTWSLLPSTIHPQIKLLFCTQVLILHQNLDTRFVNRFSKWENLSYEERISTITDSLVIGFKNINNISGKIIWLALTAGKDSRLSFAAALSAGIPFETYTAKHKNMFSADENLPVKLSRYKGIQHHLLHRKSFSEKKYEEYCAFSGNNSLGTDAEFYATGQFDQIPDNAINIKSGLFEAGQSYARKIAGGDENSFYWGIKNYYKSSFDDEIQTSSFNEWMEYQKKNPMPGIDIRDRFYLEQRLNGWASALEQSLDINPFSTIHIANSAVVMGCLLYAKEEDRRDLKLSYDLIRTLDAGLLDFPVNKRTFEDLVRIVVNGFKRRLHLWA